MSVAQATIERLRLDDEAAEEVIDLFHALRVWQERAQAHSAASRRAMRLGETDMRAVRFLVAAARDGRIVTATALAEHLRISAPAVTKLIGRLERAGHLRTEAHPHDRRARSLVLTDAARERASSTVGRDHVRRLEAIASLTSEQRRAATAALRTLAALPVLDPELDIAAAEQELGQNGGGPSGA